jgi:hypothetical protein
MAISLTTNYNIPGGARLEFPSIGNFDDDQETWTVKVELRTSSPNGRRLICATTLQIRNGVCHQLERKIPGAPEASLNIDDVNYYFAVTSRTVATGYTDAKAAERAAANTPSARRAALEAFLFTAGHIGSSLAGS